MSRPSSDTPDPDFFSAVKRLAGWITAGLGWIAGTVAVIQLARDEWGLFSRVALGACFVLVWGSLWYVRLRRREGRVSSEPLPYYDARKRHRALLGLFIWPLLWVGVGAGWYAQQRLADEEKFIVLVADFDGPDATYGVTETILSNLRRATNRYTDTEIVALGQQITAREGSVVARARGKARGATIVLWGWYRVPEDTALVTVHFEVLKDITRPTLQTGERSARVVAAALEHFRVQTRVSSEMGYLTSLTLGLVRLEASDFEAAIERLSAALGQASTPPGMVHPAIVYFYRGVAYFQQSQYDRAIADYDRTLELDPTLAAAYCNRGKAYADKDQYDRAMADFDRALELDPNLAVAYYNRGNALARKGRHDRAIADYDRALELDPNLAAAYYNRGVAYFQKGQPGRAIADYDQALKRDPNHALAYNNRGVAYARKGRYDRAIADYDRALKRDPNYALAYNNRGKAYSDQGRHDRAIANFDRALDLDPNLAVAYNNRGVAYARKGRYDRAIADYDRALERDPNYALAYNNRGMTYRKLGDDASADADEAMYKQLTSQGQ